MSDEIVQASESSGLAQPSAGSLLRAAREAQGLHIAALAVSLKVPVKKLEALEADRLQDLHDAVFVRALASSVCRALKIDPTPILDKLPKTVAPRLNHEEQGINAPFRGSGDGQNIQSAISIPKPVLLAVAALCVAALLVFFLPSLLQKFSDLGASMGSSAATPIMPPEPPANTDVVVTPITKSVATSPSVSSSVPVVIASLGASAPALANSNKTDSKTVALEQAVNNPSESLLFFKATGKSWVDVLDAKGNVVLRRTLQAGDTAGAAGALPLNVTIGSADQTQVWVRGKAFTSFGNVRKNVARFNVN